MLALDLRSADLAKTIVRQLFDRGIIINRTHETVLRFLPPYIIEKKHVDEVIQALDQALKSSSSAPAPQVAHAHKTRRTQ
jgi:acetylornithine aminotransferase/acetylornithine/N-succinyldiaminopimelate aminotransferase